MNEVIGRKADYHWKCGIIFTIIGLLAIALTVTLRMFKQEFSTEFVLLIIVSVVFISAGIFYLTIDRKSPKEMITYNKDTETFSVVYILLLSVSKIEIKLNDINKINQRNYSLKRSFLYFSSGRIELVLKDGRAITCYNVDDVDKVKSKIDSIITLKKNEI